MPASITSSPPSASPASLPSSSPTAGQRLNVIAQPFGALPQRISVKGRRQNGKATHVDFAVGAWDWLAVIVRENGATQTWMLPRSAAMDLSSAIQNGRRLYLARLAREGVQWAENFAIGAPVSEAT